MGRSYNLPKIAGVTSFKTVKKDDHNSRPAPFVLLLERYTCMFMFARVNPSKDNGVLCWALAEAQTGGRAQIGQREVPFNRGQREVHFKERRILQVPSMIQYYCIVFCCSVVWRDALAPAVSTVTLSAA